MLLLLPLTLILFCAMTQTHAGESVRTSQTGEIRIPGPIEKVFSLFTPQGELLWIPYWKFSAVYPESGDTECDMVFRTDGGSTTWTLARYEPPHTSVYVLMNSDLVARIEVNCRAESASETLMRITYVWTALTETGREQLAHFTESEFKAKMARWHSWLDEYRLNAGWQGPIDG